MNFNDFLLAFKKRLKKFKYSFAQYIFFGFTWLFAIGGGWTALNFGFGNDFWLYFIFALATFLFGKFWIELKNVKWLMGVAAGFIVLYLGLMAFIFVAGQTEDERFRSETDGSMEDFIVTLGYGLWRDQIPQVLLERLEKTYDLATRSGMFIILSGGTSPNVSVSQAEVMEAYLLYREIEDFRIYTEPDSRNTLQNLYNSFVLADSYLCEPRIVLITSDFHMYRAAAIANHMGFSVVTRLPAKTPLWALPQSLFREAAAVIKLWIWDLGIRGSNNIPEADPCPDRDPDEPIEFNIIN